MTSKEFIIWLKGFIAASNLNNISPKQYEMLEIIINNLNTVNDGPPADTVWTSTNTSHNKNTKILND